MPRTEHARPDPGLGGTRVVVVGLGASGLAAVEALVEAGAEVLVSEVSERPGEGLPRGVELRAGGHEPEHLDGADLVVTSPGVPESAEILRWARERAIPIWSELELGARLATSPYVAITGTNGKTTTTEMVAAILRADGRDVVACGNAGHPFSRAARESHDALAVEVSSYQLRFHETFHPRVSAILNIAPDHLDWHGGLERYREAKARVFARQSAEDLHVGNRDDPVAAAVSERAPCPVVWCTLRAPEEGEVGYEGAVLRSRVGSEVDLGTPSGGPGMRLDAAAAAAIALGFGASPEAVADGLAGFRPLPHRGEVVAQRGGVRFVDDSKATNPHAAIGSISGFDEVVLVAGGRAKGVDLSPLAAATPRLTGVVALGEAAGDIERIFAGSVPVVRVASIEEAVAAGAELAGGRGVVLLAPACASQDMFADYRERGDRFAAAAREIAGEGS